MDSKEYDQNGNLIKRKIGTNILDVLIQINNIDEFDADMFLNQEHQVAKSQGVNFED